MSTQVLTFKFESQTESSPIQSKIKERMESYKRIPISREVLDEKMTSASQKRNEKIEEILTKLVEKNKTWNQKINEAKQKQAQEILATQQNIEKALEKAQERRHEELSRQAQRLRRRDEARAENVNRKRSAEKEQQQKMKVTLDQKLERSQRNRANSIKLVQEKARLEALKSQEKHTSVKSAEHREIKNLDEKVSTKLEQAKERRSRQIQATQEKAQKTSSKFIKFMNIINEKGVFSEK